MRSHSYSYAAWLLLALGGCSHIPDPGAVPDVEPQQILQNIRCEIAGVLLREYPRGDPYYDWVREADIAYGLTLRAEEKKHQYGLNNMDLANSSGHIHIKPKCRKRA